MRGQPGKDLRTGFRGEKWIRAYDLGLMILRRKR